MAHAAGALWSILLAGARVLRPTQQESCGSPQERPVSGEVDHLSTNVLLSFTESIPYHILNAVTRER